MHSTRCDVVLVQLQRGQGERVIRVSGRVDASATGMQMRMPRYGNRNFVCIYE